MIIKGCDDDYKVNLPVVATNKGWTSGHVIEQRQAMTTLLISIHNHLAHIPRDVCYLTGTIRGTKGQTL